MTTATQTRTFEIDKAHSEAAFQVRHLLSKIRGRFSDFGGRIEFDVDWSLLDETGQWFLCCADNGDGMTRSELERYTTTLAVRGAGRAVSNSAVRWPAPGGCGGRPVGSL